MSLSKNERIYRSTIEYRIGPAPEGAGPILFRNGVLLKSSSKKNLLKPSGQKLRRSTWRSAGGSWSMGHLR